MNGLEIFLLRPLKLRRMVMSRLRELPRGRACCQVQFEARSVELRICKDSKASSRNLLLAFGRSGP